MGDTFLTTERATIEHLFEFLKSEAAKKLPGALREADRLPESVEDLDRLLSVAYWASHEKNEGRTLTFSLILAPQDRFPAEMIIVFAETVVFDEENLARIAPIVGRCFGLGVSCAGGGFRIWGMVLKPVPSVVVKVAGPGSILVRLDFENVAVIDGSKCVLAGAGAPQAALVLADGFAATVKEPRRTVLAALLLQIADAMRRHRNGGALVVVPSDDLAWKESVTIRQPTSGFVALASRLTGYVGQIEAELQKQPNAAGARRASWFALHAAPDIDCYLRGEYDRVDIGLQRLVAAIGGLTAVDGAAVFNDKLEGLGFGAVLHAPPTSTPVLVWTLPSIIAGREPRSTDLDQIGGTRHRSAVELVAGNRDCVALVASHDGPVSLVTWDLSRSSVVLIKGVEVLLDQWI